VLRSALLLFSGNAVTSLLTLARNLLLARLLPVEDYGIAATYAIAMAVVEMISALGMEQQIVQARDGNDPRFQAALHTFTFVRSLFSATVFFLAGGLIADFLGVPDLAWAYQTMALVPLSRGLMHFDVHRLKREMRFGPLMKLQLGGALVALVSILPAYAIWGDHRAMLASLLVQTLVTTVLSHMMAHRSYRMAWAPDVWRSTVSFGWPLLVNAVLIFVIMHGEKVIVGRALNLEALAIIAMGLTLTMTPTLILGRSLQNLFLPQLSALRDDDKAYQDLSQTSIQTVTALTLMYLLTVALVGGPVAMLLLGPAYAALPPLMVLLAIQQTLRVLKEGGSTVGLARGQTANVMAANAVRVISLPIAYWVAVSGGGLEGIILVAIASEAIGLAVSFVMVHFYLRISLKPAMPAVIAGLIATAATEPLSMLSEPASRLPSGLEALMLSVVVLAALAVQTRFWRLMVDIMPFGADRPSKG
jgi:O-antigen/teichoic acid export membrane protein